MNGLCVDLLGPVFLELDGVPLHKFRTNRVQALLIYLVTESILGTNRHRREKLCDLFWPDSPLEQASPNLRQTIYHLKKTVPDRIEANDGQSIPFLLADRHTLAINPAYPVSCDLQRFQDLLRGPPQEWIQAVNLYRGDFIENFSILDVDPFEAWARTRRTAFHQQALDALASLARHYEDHGFHQEAIGFARRQIDLDPLQERSYQQLMAALARSGRRVEALALYDELADLLKDELGVEPDSNTQSLREEILAGEIGEATHLTRKLHGFELKEKIGAGAYGAVYRARQPAVDREVAVKVILPRYANDPDFIRRFDGEARTIARLEHPHIIPLYDYWREPDNAYLVMRWLRQGNLRQALSAGPLPDDRAVQLVDQVASALEAAHRQQIIHRDLKPENILLDEENNAYLSDFGIAIEGTHRQGGPPDTPITSSFSSISPEEIRQEPLTPAADIYCFGVLLYEILTGRPPFPDQTFAGLVHKHATQPLPSITPVRPDLAPGVDAVIQKATAKEPGDRFASIQDLALAFRRAMAAGGDRISPTAHATRLALENPYKGLAPFTENDAPLFFGREAMTARLVERLATYENFLALVGPSGSGKSSLVKAGLIPALRRDALPGSSRWFFAGMTPGAHPFEEFELALLRIAVRRPAPDQVRLRADERGLLRAVRAALPDDQTPLLLVIDQFEELFTLVEDPDLTARFLQALQVAITDPRSPLHVVISLRADFYDRPLLNPDFNELVRQHTEVITPMSAANLAAAIRRPAERTGLLVDPDLVTRLVSDTIAQPGGLPLMQFALAELFDQRREDELTLAGYEAIGGIAGLLGRRAEELFVALDSPSQGLARQVFLRLVTLGDGAEATRRRATQAELAALVPAGDSTANPEQRLRAVLAPFAASRLLLFDREPVSREPAVQVAHEALLQEWERLRRWLDDSRTDLQLQQQLARDAAEWQAAVREPGFLLRGARLDRYAEWPEKPPLELTPLEWDYLNSSLATRRSRQAAEESRRQAELETAQQLAETERTRALEQAAAAMGLRRRAAYLLGALVLAAVLALAAGLFARSSRENASLAATRAAEAGANAGLAAEKQAEAEANAAAAERERDRAETARGASQTAAEEARIQRLAAEASEREAQQAYSLALAANARESLADGDGERAILLALTANTVPDPPTAARRALMDAAFAPGTRRIIPIGASAQTLAISPDGRNLVTGSEDGAVRLWDLASGELVREMKGHTNFIWEIAYSPDGRQALSASADRTAILWDLASGEIVHTLAGHDYPVRTLRFTPDGKRALSGDSSEKSPGQLILWDLESGEEIRRYYDIEKRIGAHEETRSLALTPDGTRALVGEGATLGLPEPEQLYLVDLDTGEIVRSFDAGPRSVNGVAISPDGRTGLSGSADNIVRLWDLESGAELLRLNGHQGIVAQVAFSPDGRTAASTSLDNTIIHWDLTRGAIIQQFRNIQGLWGVAFVDERTLATTSNDGTVRLWDLESRWLLDRWGTGSLKHGGPVSDLAFSPDGRYALSGSEWFESGVTTGYLILWDVETGRPIRAMEDSDLVFAIRFLPDGRRAVATHGNGRLVMWDLETGQAIWSSRQHRFSVPALAVSHDGRYALTGGDDTKIILWDLETGQPRRQFIGHQKMVRSIVFSPDDSLAISGSEDQSLIIWDIATGRQIRRLTGLDSPVGGHIGNSVETGGILEISLRPDGRTLLTSSPDKTLIHWDLASGQSTRRFIGHDEHAMDVDFTPDGRRALSAAKDNNLILWDVATGLPIRYFPIGDSLWLVNHVAISPDGQTAISGEPDGTILKWRLAEPRLDETLAWIEENRPLRELTCLERATFNIEPLCDAGGRTAGTTDALLAQVRAAAAELITGPLPAETVREPLRFDLPERPVQPAQIGENRGSLAAGTFDIWEFEGEAGEILAVQMIADHPAIGSRAELAAQIAAGQLDTVFNLIGPDGELVITAEHAADGLGPDAELAGFLLPVNGRYRIEARSRLDSMAGRYRLRIDLERFVLNSDDLVRLAGCYDEGFGQSVGAYGKFSPDGQQLRTTNTINDFSVLLTPIAIDRVVVEFGGTMTFQIDENGMVRGYEGVTTDGIRYTAVRVDDELCARAP